MADIMIPRRSHEIMEALTAEDFETASIRSAAPSYCEFLTFLFTFLLPVIFMLDFLRDLGALLIWAQCVVIGVFRSSAGHTRARKQRAPRMALSGRHPCSLPALRVCPSCLMLLHASLVSPLSSSRPSDRTSANRFDHALPPSL